MKVLSFGEILFDLIEGKPYLGGAPLNFAGHLARLGADSYILSAVGKDGLGEEALRQTSAIGVKTDYIQVVEAYPTGTVRVMLSAGQPDYTILKEVAYDHIAYKGELACASFELLYFGTLAQRSTSSRNTLQQLLQAHQFQEIFYDVNLRKESYSQQVIEASLACCSLLKLNDEEVQLLAQMLYQQELSPETFARRLAQDWQLKVVLITAGARGCWVLHHNRFDLVPGYPAQVVDTVGAGDAFSAAFLFQYMRHGDAVAAADRANRLGAFVASYRGPLPEYTEELKCLLK